MSEKRVTIKLQRGDVVKIGDDGCGREYWGTLLRDGKTTLLYGQPFMVLGASHTFTHTCDGYAILEYWQEEDSVFKEAHHE